MLARTYVFFQFSLRGMGASVARLLLFSIMISTTTPSQAQGFLHAQGQQIVDGAGQNVLLRAMGLGGWMLQEGYMLQVYDKGQQHEIKKRIQRLVGSKKTQAFYDAWLTNHTRKTDVDSMKAWGFNSIRLPMHYNLYTLPIEQEPVAGKNTWLPRGFEMTDSLLAWCKANSMYLILDLHGAPGGQGNDLNISDGDTSKPSLWASEANRNKTVALWKELARRYANEPWIGAYDILNEPNFGFVDPMKDRNGLNEPTNEPLKQLYQKITGAIRQVDTNHLIIIEGNGWGNNYNGMMPTWDNNMALSFHKYWNDNDEQSINKLLVMRNIFKVPVWLGETGENSNVWFTQAISLLERNNIGWAWWPLKKVGFSNPLEVPAPKGYEAILKYWSTNKNKPDSTTAFKVFMQLAANTRIENNIYHKDVIDAMFRQPHTNETLPFKQYNITNGAVHMAVDYDLGKNGFAYYDVDTANYWVSGRPGEGNKGKVYRNDGVDIYAEPGMTNSFYLGDTKPGEWVQYTVSTPRAGSYILEFSVAGLTNNASFDVLLDDVVIAKGLRVKKAVGITKWANLSTGKFTIAAGTHRLRIKTNTGGFNLKSIKWVGK